MYCEHVFMSLSILMPGSFFWLHSIPLHGNTIICLASRFPAVGHVTDISLESSQEDIAHLLFSLKDLMLKKKRLNRGWKSER